MSTDLHVLYLDGVWRLRVGGRTFGGWPQHRAVTLALRAGRTISSAPGISSRVIVYEPDGAVRTVVDFPGRWTPRRPRRKTPPLSPF